MRIAITHASASSPLTWMIGISNPFAMSLAYRVERASTGSVVNPIWLLTMRCSVPPTRYPRSRERLIVSGTMPSPGKAASPAERHFWQARARGVVFGFGGLSDRDDVDHEHDRLPPLDRKVWRSLCAEGLARWNDTDDALPNLGAGDGLDEPAQVEVFIDGKCLRSALVVRIADLGAGRSVEQRVVDGDVIVDLREGVRTVTVDEHGALG